MYVSVATSGAVGGIAHGVTMQQSFHASSWRRPPVPDGGFGPSWRVYVPQLDLLLKPKMAQALFAADQGDVRLQGYTLLPARCR
jgi:hypothetical protein